MATALLPIILCSFAHYSSDSQGKPAINLAIGGSDDQKRYLLGHIVIGQSDAKTPAPTSVKPDRNGNSWQSSIRLRPNQTYLVSFSYEVIRDPEHDLNTDDPGYFRFYAVGEDKNGIGETRWFDNVSQSPARKTLLLATEGIEDYKLVWESVFLRWRNRWRTHPLESMGQAAVLLGAVLRSYMGHDDLRVGYSA